MIWYKFENGSKGISDIEGKAATGSGERAGKRASFKFVSENSTSTIAFIVCCLPQASDGPWET